MLCKRVIFYTLAEMALSAFFSSVFKNFNKFESGTRISLTDLKTGYKFDKLIAYIYNGSVKVEYNDVVVVYSGYSSGGGTYEVKVMCKYMVEYDDGRSIVYTRPETGFFTPESYNINMEPWEDMSNNYMAISLKNFNRIKDILPNLYMTDWLFGYDCKYLEIPKCY